MYSLWLLSRHYVIHATAALIGYLILRNYTEINILHFILGSFILDADHFLAWFHLSNSTTRQELKILRSSNPWETKLREVVKVYWKKGFSKLLFHNFLALGAFSVLLFVFKENILVFSFLIAVLIHQVVDIIGDIVRWRSLNNWLWRSI